MIAAYNLDRGRAPEWITDGGFLPHTADGKDWLCGYVKNGTDIKAVGGVELTEPLLVARLGTLSKASAESMPEALATLGFTAARDTRARDIEDAMAEIEQAKLPATAKLLARLAARTAIVTAPATEPAPKLAPKA